ncbi:bifunctional acetate--CoA ligase family protein/GNAT family N-acetyltransferase [Ornithinimicrobium avium]|uniref:GNAT family N-acetyltransferase n=1 Tax=Ornithinimicrobium avium TaxID=2283195 RepID=A0A345NS93_9MICO|nr:bifunctional GNAT family N-acetyltransferase/acetate--CoA ligase family protein [Ornithinimicrobium avium]AXH97901.1 GNAT family N-acetyltransferase [Ornithinimicrobium avium]
MDEQDGLPPGYPQEWEADVVLADGMVAHVRPIRPDDVEALHEFHAAQSEESIYLRFFAPIKRLSDKDVHRFTHVDYSDRVALVVMIRGKIAGIGRYDRLKPGGPEAEVAFNVSDDHQGRGIGSVLLEHLADIAREAGVRRFVADVLPQNRKMIGVFRDAGYDASHEFDDGVIAVTFDIEPTDESRAVRMSREHRSESRSVRRLLHPASVAVIGASRREATVGRAFLDHIAERGFAGDLYAVNNRAEPGTDIGGLPSYRSVRDIEGGVELAVVAVPAADVLATVDECADAGVRALVVPSEGFAEAGPEGEHRQRQLLMLARGYGMRVLGPNSFGIINNDPQVRLDASLAEPAHLPPHGSLGLFAQSGALGIAVLASAQRRGLGISTFASAGNRVDVSGNDLMQYWLDDDATTAVGLHLESMGNPRKFSRIARKLSSVKPVIVVKSGVGGRFGTPRGHRVRTTQERPEAFTQMLKQAGVIRAENTHQLFDVAQLVINQPLPAGHRVGVVTNSDALGSLAADAAQSWGLDVTHGPVAVAAEAGVAEFRRVVEEALADDHVDSLIACFIPPVAFIDPEVVQAVGEAVAGSEKPCVATFLGMRGVTPGSRLPTYTTPEDGVRALAAATRYAEWLRSDRGTRVRPDGINRGAVNDVVAAVLARSPRGADLSQEETTAVLAAYGIEVWPSVTVSSDEEAVEVYRQLRGTVVLKATSPLLSHQPGQGWIRTGLRHPKAVGAAYRDLARMLEPLGADGIAVQRMAAPGGVAVEVHSSEDALFGPVVGFGVAGLPIDLLGDMTSRFPPLTDVDIVDMVTSIRAAPMLDGYRGVMPVDHAALYDLIARVSVLADDHPELAHLRLNPVMAHQDGVDVLGASLHVAPAPTRTDAERRAMSS